MTLAILPQCPTWKDSLQPIKPLEQDWRVAHWPEVSVLVLPQLRMSSQLPVWTSFLSSDLVGCECSMLWDGALRWTYNSIGLLCGAKGFKGTSLCACFLLTLVQTLWCYLCSCSSFPWEIPWKARTVNFHFESSLSIFGCHAKLRPCTKLGSI